MDTTQLTRALSGVDPLVWAAVAGVLLLLVVAMVVLLVRRRRRRQLLKERYGAEYAHTAQRAGSSRGADRDLLAREQRRRTYQVRELEAGERERFRSRWEALQASFVDSPHAAVRDADELLAEVASAKGYDTPGDDPLSDVSVDHPLTLDRYRSGREGGVAESDRPTTERLRLAMLGARELFETVVGRDHTEAEGGSSAFRGLVEEDDGAPHAPADGHDDEPGGPLAQGHTGEMPLYGPDGRPLGNEASGRRH